MASRDSGEALGKPHPGGVVGGGPINAFKQHSPPNQACKLDPLSREEGTSGWIWGSHCALPVWLQDFSTDILSSDLLGAFCIQGGPCLGIHLSHLGKAPVSGPL